MKINQLSKIIDDKTILESVSIDLVPGEIVGLIGRNGSGKTTLFRTLVGHYLPDTGDVSIDETSLHEKIELQKEVFYIDEQYHFLNSYTLIKIGRFYQSVYPDFDFDRFLELIQKQKLPLRKSYRSMSKGMQGLFNMILAICSNARYLFLDEPFDGLDVIVRKNVIRLLLENISESKRSVVISSHNLVELESLVDRVILLKDSHITKDYRLEDIRENARKIQMVFPMKNVPEIVRQHSKVLTIQGRVVTALFENYTEELVQQIMAYNPLVFEELPLTLEDLFEANLSREADYQLFI